MSIVADFQQLFGWAPTNPGIAHETAIAEYARLLKSFDEAKNHLPLVKQAALALGQYTQHSQQYFDHMNAPEQLDLFGVARTPALDLQLLKFLAAQIHKYADQYRACWLALYRTTFKQAPGAGDEDDLRQRLLEAAAIR